MLADNFLSMIGLIIIVSWLGSIALKLAGVITWPWLWVMSPVWLPLALGFAFVSITMGIFSLGRLFLMIFGR